MSLPAQHTQSLRGLAPGTRLGRYVVVRRLGSGGMAELYLARLDGPHRFVKPVALKLMHAHMLDDPTLVEMFLREARISATLEHPGIVQVLDVGNHLGEHFLALEYVHGLDLRRILADRRFSPIPLGLAVRIVLDVGAALHYAHCLCDCAGRPLDIVHRDVSPSNVMISFAGAVKLADFGIARMAEHTQVTATGTLKGKIGYMSPEQCLQQRVDARSDVFALGVVLYETTTGRRAFPGEPIAAMNRVIDGAWTPPHTIVPGYPARLAEIVARALATRVDDRYPSVAALCEDLQAAAVVAGLDTRTATLAGMLAARYGAPALPDLGIACPLDVHRGESEPRIELAGTTRVIEPARPRRFLRAGALLGVLTIGGVLGWQVPHGATEVELPVPATIESAPPEHAIATTAPLPVIAPEPAPIVAEPAPPPTRSDHDAQPVRRSARKKKAPAPRPVESPSSTTRDDMLPRFAR